jgi:hypothetical protein
MFEGIYAYATSLVGTGGVLKDPMPRALCTWVEPTLREASHKETNEGR